MKRPVRCATRAAAVVVTLVLAARCTGAAPLTYGVSGTNASSASAPAESVTFDASGTNLFVTLVDTPGAGVSARPEALTAIFSAGNPTLPDVGDAEPAYGGYHDLATCDAIAGWVWNPQQPDTPLAVSIYADERMLVTLTADQFRRDLLDAHVGNGHHGFASPLPPSLKDGKAHQIRVTVAGSDFELPKTPREITCARDPGSK